MTSFRPGADLTVPPSASPDEPSAEVAAPEPAPAPSPQAEAHNFLVLAVYQIVLRTGWIFKTESVIMPAVLDQLTANQPWIRGALPVLNRLGQSVPPALFAHTLQQQPRKKSAFVWTTALMAIAFGGLTAIFLVPHPAQSSWPALLYLALYGFFFATLGVNNLVLNTLQGKLIRVTHRGRLLLISNVVGAAIAISAALILLPQWLSETKVNAAAVFGFSTGVFIVASAISWFLKEEPDDLQVVSRPWWQAFADAGETLRHDRPFRRFAFVAALYATSLTLFPHFQAVGIQELHFDQRQLVWWLIVQNIGTAIISVPIGMLADRFGNRLAMQFLLLGAFATPLLAVAIVWRPELGRDWFNIVFGMLGLSPVVFKTLNNYALEIAPPHQHARYLGTLNLCLASPIPASLIVSWVLGRLGFEAAFLAIAAVIAVGWLISFTLIEPRNAGRKSVTV